MLTMAEAVREAMSIAFDERPEVFLLGEDVGIYGGAFGVSGDMYHRYGAERVLDTPIAELGIVGAAVGAALSGMRPIVEIQFSDFTAQAMDQIANQAAKIHFMLGGALHVPMVLRTPQGSGTGAIDDPNPVIFLEHKLLYKIPGRDPVPEGATRIPLGVSKVVREGKDLTIVATGIMVNKSYEVAEKLAAEGISITLIDPRTISPLDMQPVFESVEKTGRLLVVQEGPAHAGFINEVIAQMAGSSSFGSLIAPIKRLAGMNIPIPYAPQLEKAAVPQIEDIEAAAREIVKNWR